MILSPFLKRYLVKNNAWISYSRILELEVKFILSDMDPNSQVSSKFKFWPIPSHYIRQKTWSNQKVIRLFKCQVHENHEGYWSGSVSVWARSHLFFSSGKKVSLSRTFRHLKSVALQLEREYELTNSNCWLDNMHDFS